MGVAKSPAADGKELPQYLSSAHGQASMDFPYNIGCHMQAF